jgi:hypothetical protein
VLDTKSPKYLEMAHGHISLSPRRGRAFPCAGRPRRAAPARDYPAQGGHGAGWLDGGHGARGQRPHGLSSALSSLTPLLSLPAFPCSAGPAPSPSPFIAAIVGSVAAVAFPAGSTLLRSSRLDPPSLWPDRRLHGWIRRCRGLPD